VKETKKKHDTYGGGFCNKKKKKGPCESVFKKKAVRKGEGQHFSKWKGTRDALIGRPGLQRKGGFVKN